MTMKFIDRDPARVSLTNLNTGEQLTVQFNPAQLSRRGQVNYARKRPIGQSHEPLHYVNTGNQSFILDLFYDHVGVVSLEGKGSYSTGSARRQEQFERNQDARKFIESLAYPEEDGTIFAEPPDVLIVWPKNLSMVCKLISFSFVDERFNTDGAPIQFTAVTQWEESRVSRLTSRTVRDLGGLRSKTNLGES